MACFFLASQLTIVSLDLLSLYTRLSMHFAASNVLTHNFYKQINVLLDLYASLYNTN